MIPLLRDRYPFYDPKHHPKQINTLHTTRSSFLPTFRTKRNPIFSTFYTRGEKALKRAIRNLLRADRRKIVIPEREREERVEKVDTGFNAVCKSERAVTREGGVLAADFREGSFQSET